MTLRLRPRSHPLLRKAAQGALAVWVAGVLIRLTVKDQFAGVAMMFYAVPWPVLMVLPLPAIGLWWREGRRGRMILGLGASLACAATWLAGSWFSRAQPIEPGGLRVVFHNSAHPNERAWTPILAALPGLKADIIGLVEGKLEGSAAVARLQAAFPDHVLRRFPKHHVLLVRGEVLQAEERSLGQGSRCEVVNVRVEGRPFTVVLVDLASSPRRPRREAFAQLTAILAERAGETLVVMGDFNTPRESRWFEPWGDGLLRAFETAGVGFAETWPLPVPLLCIDHVWSTPDLRPVRCETEGGWGSDHRALVVDFATGP